MKKLIILTGVFLFFVKILSAQNFTDAGEYLNFIITRENSVTEKMWDYVRTISHTRKEGRQEKKKQELIREVKKARAEIAAMPAFEGSTALRDSVVEHMDFYLKTLTGDLTELEKLEVASQKTFAAMLKFLKKQEQINNILEKKHDAVKKLTEAFAAAHNINLVESEENKKMNEKIKITNAVYDYYDKFYLAYFRLILAQSKLADIINNQQLEELDSQLDTIKEAIVYAKDVNRRSAAYKGDYTLKNTISQMTSNTIEIQNNLFTVKKFWEVKSSLEAAKAKIESKPKNQLTQEEVDDYNNLVAQYNSLVPEYNKAVQKINKLMQENSQLWEKNSFKFLNKHVPK